MAETLPEMQEDWGGAGFGGVNQEWDREVGDAS